MSISCDTLEFSVRVPLEMYFASPLELTGSNPEPARGSERVVHVEQAAGIGATVERFEELG